MYVSKALAQFDVNVHVFCNNIESTAVIFDGCNFNRNIQQLTGIKSMPCTKLPNLKRFSLKHVMGNQTLLHDTFAKVVSLVEFYFARYSHELYVKLII